MARLIVNPGSPVAWEIELKAGTNLLGRGFANDFKIADPSVSGAHCQVDVGEQGVVIKDLGSTNGTFINRSPIREAVLQPGQTIHLGSVELLFESEATPSNRPAPTVIPAAPVAPSIPIARAVPIRAAVVGTPPPPAPPIPSVPQPPAPNVSIPPATVRVAAPASPGVVPISIAPKAPPPSLRPAAPAPVPPVLPPPIVVTAPPIPSGTAGGPAAGQHTCKFHPKTAARFSCGKCHHYFCELCVISRAAGGVQHKFCRQCGTECTAVQVRLERAVQAGFFGRLGGAFGYPFRGAGFFLMVVGIILFSGLKFGRYMMFIGGLRQMVFGIILQIFAGGYLFTFLQAIIHSTAAEDREMPDLPAMTSVIEDILLPFGRLLGWFLICFGIAIPLAIWVSPVAAVAAVILGGLYGPMAFLAIAILDSIGAANPLVVIPAILKVPLEYVVTLILLAVVYSLTPFGTILINAAFPRGLLAHSMAEMFAYLAANAFWGFFSFYLLIVSVHVLGLLYVSKRDKLGWLDR